MIDKLKAAIVRALRRFEPYIKTDLSYLIKSGFWLNLGYLFAAFLSFILSILFAHFVPKETYGVYKYILSIAGIASALSLTGINVAVMRSVAQGFDGIFKKSIIEQLKWSVPQFIFLLTAAGYYLHQGNVTYASALLIISILAPISSIANTYGAVLYGKKDFRTSAWYSMISNFAYFIGMAAVIIGLPLSVIFLVVGYYLVTASANIFFCYRTYKKYHDSLSTDTYRPEDISYSKHLSLMSIVGTLASQADNILVYFMLGPVSLALYSFVTIVPERIRVMFGFISSAAFPKIAEKDLDAILPTAKRKTWQLVILALCISAVYIAIAPLFFKIFYPQYQSVVIYSQVFSLSLIAIATNIPWTALLAHRKQEELYIISFGVPAAKIILSAVGIFYLGLWGAVLAKMANQIMLLASSSYYLHKKS